MRRALLLPFLSLLSSCTVGHRVGENDQNHDAISCAAALCGGTTVCVDSACVEPTGACGGFAGLQCAAGERCVDDPRDGCDPTNGGADCGGVCVAPSAPVPDAGTTQPDGGTVPLSCGGHVINPQMCPSGYKCVDDPNSCSMAVDCPGICAPDTHPDVIALCGGFIPAPNDCGTGNICVSHPSNCCDQPGICIKKVFCGGFAALPCPGGLSCVDDWTDNCDPNNGGADCGGICVVPLNSQPCGGIAGFTCPSGLRCLDDPADSCDPNSGGADCGGICVP